MKSRKALLTITASAALVLTVGISATAIASKTAVRATSTDADITSEAASAGSAVTSVTTTLNQKMDAAVGAAVSQAATVAAQTTAAEDTEADVSAYVDKTTVNSVSNVTAGNPYARTNSVAVNSQNEHTYYSFVRDGDATYFYLNGQLQKGLVKIDKEDLFFFDLDTGKMVTGWMTVDGVTYYFQPGSGIAVKDGFFNIGGETYYFNKLGGLESGMRKVDDDRYYLDQNTSELTHGFQLIGDSLYYMDAGTGEVQTGWFDVDGNTYYASSTGVIVRGQKKWIDGKKSRNNNGITEREDFSGKYLFDENGVMQTGFVWEGKNLYYYDEVYGMIFEGGPGTVSFYEDAADNDKVKSDGGNGVVKYGSGWFNSDEGWIYAQSNGKLYYNTQVSLDMNPYGKEYCSFDENGIIIK